MTELVATRALNPTELGSLTPIGYADEAERSATCIIIDQDVSHINNNDADVEVLPIAEALRKYEWVQELMFGLIDPDENEHVKRVTDTTLPPIGHFIHVKEGANVQLPLQTFTLLETPQARQYVHNITVVEKNAQIEMISGSAVPPTVHRGNHISISETYLREGANCRSLSIERWGDEMEVYSYARTHVGKNATTAANSIMLSKIKHHYADDRTSIEEGGVSTDQSIVFAPRGTDRTSDSTIELRGDGASAESIARMVSGGGNITNRSYLVGSGENTKGYLGCDGLKLAEDGYILSEPSLKATTTKAELSHEASIGMIDEEKMAYLMAAGMTEDSARDLIIQGFLNIEDQQLPDSIRQQVIDMVAQAKSGSL